MNDVIRRKLMKIERPSRSIKQQYERAMNLDRHWSKSKREEERLKRRKETGAPRTNTLATASRAQEQQLLQPQVQPKRQEFQQQAPTGPVSMEGVERTNIVIVSPNQWTGFMPSKENQGGKNKNKKEKKEEKKK